MPIGVDLQIITEVPTSASEEAALLNHDSLTKNFLTGGRHNDDAKPEVSFCVLELDWARRSESPEFTVRISINGAIVAIRTPRASIQGESFVDRVLFAGRILHSDEENTISFQPLSAEEFLLRSATILFHQDF